MGPDHIRKRWGFAGLLSAPLTLMTAAPALAQSLAPTHPAGIAAMTVALGAGGFALIAMIVLRAMLSDGRAARRRAAEQIASLRAQVDEYENLISGGRELTVLWAGDSAVAPRVLGQASAILPTGRRAQSVLNLHSWLGPAEANRLDGLLDALRLNGHGFSESLVALDGRPVQATGWVMGVTAALRLRPILVPGDEAAAMRADAREEVAENDRQSLRAALAAMPDPAFLRDGADRLVYANAAYISLARSLGRSGGDGMPPELLDETALSAHLAACGEGSAPISRRVELGAPGAFDLVEFAVSGGRAGFLHPAVAEQGQLAQQGVAANRIGGIIEALATPIAIFNARRELIQFNQAYAALWGLERSFLSSGIDEGAILDRLRTGGLLPNQVDYRTWRARHLESYGRKEPFEDEPWHLPDGRTIKVFSAPAGPEGGVIYVFEDVTERLELESTNKAFTDVLRETINALSEAVAVFGTNGRLTLSNPQMEKLWTLPMAALGKNPHFDQIAEASSRALPEDGAAIWRDLKRGTIDLNPTRTDQTGRITRSDGRLIDYAITRLPDGQTMMTFLDVTESASYSQVLKERNDALVAADRLKDAFVENVSYELRSPLTNIIGFADLLADSAGGSLNARQRDYIDYIRASSVTLGVLIDNILDLASVDAGIAELNLEPLEVAPLIEKARAGITATFPEVSGDAPRLTVNIEPGLPRLVADGTRIVQVLYNLLSNAARFSPPRGEITLSVFHRAERMLFVIEDEGPGLSEEMKAAILTRVDAPAVGGRQRGAGLALSIVRTFVNLHGGTISAARRDPRGSRIIVNLPLDNADTGTRDQALSG